MYLVTVWGCLSVACWLNGWFDWGIQGVDIGKCKPELNSREECTELRDLLFLIFDGTVCYHHHIWTTHFPPLHILIIRSLTSFKYHAKWNIFFTFHDDAVDREKVWKKWRNTVAQCLIESCILCIYHWHP